MKMRCGSIDDVHPYERIHRQRNPNSNLTPSALEHHPSLRQLGQHSKKNKEKLPDTKFCEQIMVSQQQRQHTLASVSEVSMNLSGITGTAVGMKVSQRGKEAQVCQKGKELEYIPVSRKMGLVEIFMGYHSLLQATPASLGSSRRKEIYPTIGFSQEPHFR